MIKELPTDFKGTGEVKGFTFRQMVFNGRAYLYEVVWNESGLKHFEVFQRKINRRFRCAMYPKQNAFGIWAYTTRTEEKAREYYSMLSK